MDSIKLFINKIIDPLKYYKSWNGINRQFDKTPSGI
jgi:hypothetical protein